MHCARLGLLYNHFRFRGCCDRALASALQLVGWASGISVSSLKAYYQQLVQSGWFAARHTDVHEMQEDCADDDMPEEEAAVRDPCLD